MTGYLTTAIVRNVPHSEDEAKEILEPYMDGLGRVFPIAWDEWERLGEKAPELRMQMCPRTRATVLSNFATTAAEVIFADMGSNVLLTSRPGFLLMVFESKLHVRLKKYRDRSYRTSGIPTTQSKMFEWQQPLTGFPQGSNCVHGYVLKKDASGFSETAIKCSTGKAVHWSLDVPLVETSNVEELPIRREEEIAEPGIRSTMTDERAEEGGIGG